MTISSVDTFCLQAPLDNPFGYSQAWYHTRTAMLVRITDDQGREGWGKRSGLLSPSHRSSTTYSHRSFSRPVPSIQRPFGRSYTR